MADKRPSNAELRRRFQYKPGDVEFLSPEEAAKLKPPKGMVRAAEAAVPARSWWRPAGKLSKAEKRASGGFGKRKRSGGGPEGT